MIPASVRVFACGMTESGKGYWLRRLFLARVPRLVVLDPLGEYADPKIFEGRRVYRADSVEEVRKSLGLAVRNGSRWVVVSQLPPEQFAALGSVFVPATVSRPPFAALVGGVGLVCEELDLVAPSNPTPEVRGIWSRSRHVGLSIFGATQRPHGVSPIIRSQSRFHVICRQDEPADVDYLQKYLPAAAGARVPSIPWRGCLVYDKQTGAWSLLGADGRVVGSGHGGAGLDKVTDAP